MTETPLEQRTFDRRPRFDPRSRDYPIRRAAVVRGNPPRSFTWACPIYLDQGRQGACVGHAFAHDAIARPVPRMVQPQVAFDLYHAAQFLDPWEGEAYEGTSVLAGAQAYVHAGYATSYRWALDLPALVLGLGYAGPAVLGVWWHRGMTTPNVDGFITPTGGKLGGHAILARAVHLRWHPSTTPADKAGDQWWRLVDKDRSHVTLHNSWGPSWGDQGRARITLGHLELLLQDDGEALFPMGRQ